MRSNNTTQGQQTSIGTQTEEEYKHEQINPFSIYCSRRGKHSVHTSYTQNLMHIATVRTMDEFFEYFLALKKPSGNLVDSKMVIFHEKCKPFWEEWIESGCLWIKFKNKPDEEDMLDRIWEFLIYSMVGNALDQEIIGICFCKREKITLIEVWLRRNDRAKEIGLRLEEKIRKELIYSMNSNLEKLLKIMHKRHSDSISNNSTIKGAQSVLKVNFKKTSQINSSF